MIRSQRFFCTQSSVQKLQLLTSSHRDTRKSSNDSPGYWTLVRKFLRSTDGYGCDVPLLFHCEAENVDDRQCLAGETESERFHLFSLRFFVEL